MTNNLATWRYLTLNAIKFPAVLGKISYGTTTYQERSIFFFIFFSLQNPLIALLGLSRWLLGPSRWSKALLENSETLPAGSDILPAGSVALQASSYSEKIREGKQYAY